MYGDYNGPNKADKGQSGGSCNRTLCQAAPADYYNHGSYSWYCIHCAVDIGQDHVNYRGWMRDFYPSCGHAMFETQEQMDARAAQGGTLTPEQEQHARDVINDAEIDAHNARVKRRKDADAQAAYAQRINVAHKPKNKKKKLFRP